MNELSPKTDKVVKSDAEWKKQLTPEEYHVTRKHGTERAFTGQHWNNKEPGLYRCICCGTPLFESAIRFGHGLAELLGTR